MGNKGIILLTGIKIRHKCKILLFMDELMKGLKSTISTSGRGGGHFVSLKPEYQSKGRTHNLLNDRHSV